MTRLTQWLNAIRSRRAEAATVELQRMSDALAATRRHADDLSASLAVVSRRVAEARRRADDLMAVHRRQVDERARMAAIPRARLLADALELDGSPAARLRVKRHFASAPVERPFRPWMRITRCVSAAADVRAAWDRLLACEAAAPEGLLRGASATILDVPDALVSRSDGAVLHVSLQDAEASASPARPASLDEDVLAIPRFAYALAPRKLRNFSHWLLDCVPQVVALSTVAPDARFLLPSPMNRFHQASLSLVGVHRRHMIPWDGTLARCRRALILESDGRAGGGRPLSSLLETRRLVGAGTAGARGTRRIYVSRRDAKAKRRWVSNEAEVEALFRSRGFEVLCITERPLDELVAIFRDAAVVAGINGAGLAHILFSRPGTHVVVLFSDSLIRWYADETGARSLWASRHHPIGGALTPLGDSPRFYAHLAAAFEQFCHSFVAGDHMPVDRLGGFLDEVLWQAEYA